MAAFCVRAMLACFAVAMIMIAAVGVQAGGPRRCSVQDVELTNDYVTTSTCEWGLINHCPCEAFNIIANCQDRRWNQNMISHFAMEVDVPSPGLCTLMPNALVFNDTSGIRYGRTYPCAGPLPLSLKSADFGEACRGQ